MKLHSDKSAFNLHQVIKVIFRLTVTYIRCGINEQRFSGSDFVNCNVFCEWALLAALGAASMNQCAPLMMRLNGIGFIIDEGSAAGRDLTYFTENTKSD